MVSEFKPPLPREGFYSHAVTKEYKPAVGNELDGEMRLETASNLSFEVSDEELAELIIHGAKRDIEVGDLTYPPDVEEVIRKASEFYDTYLYDTDVDRVDTTVRYVNALIKGLEPQMEVDTREPSDRVEEYKHEITVYIKQVEAAALEQEALRREQLRLAA